MDRLHVNMDTRNSCYSGNNNNGETEYRIPYYASTPNNATSTINNYTYCSSNRPTNSGGTNLEMVHREREGSMINNLAYGSSPTDINKPGRKSRSKQVVCIIMFILLVTSVLLSMSAVMLSLWVAFRSNPPPPPQAMNLTKPCELEIMTNDTESDLFKLQELSQALGLQVLPECGPGLWQLVAHLDMSEHTQQCPPGWSEFTFNGVRGCGRATSSQFCRSTTYTISRAYKRVCGRATGYAQGTMDAFRRQPTIRVRTPNDPYLDGISITYGDGLRNHIWSFAVATLSGSRCLCLNGDTGNRELVDPPSFVGENYFCEFVDVSRSQNVQVEFPVWDGEECIDDNGCCELNSPPWFSVELPTETTDSIEVRLCGDELSNTNENILVESLEIYIQ